MVNLIKTDSIDEKGFKKTQKDTFQSNVQDFVLWEKIDNEREKMKEA